jgi:hypothetical protein
MIMFSGVYCRPCGYEAFRFDTGRLLAHRAGEITSPKSISPLAASSL